MASGFMNICNGMLPAAAMIGVQVIYAGVIISYKLATVDGMSTSVLVAYRSMFATLSLLPIALLLERNSRPKMTWMVAFQAFLCALFGQTLNQNITLVSLKLTSAQFVSAINNFSPAITFIVAVFFRLETATIKTGAGRGKVIGTLICIGGAMLLTFYKGKEIKIWSTNIDLLHHHHEPQKMKQSYGKFSHLLGLISSLVSNIFYSLWLIIQAKMNKNYPSYYSSSTLVSVMASIQAGVYALCIERNNWEAWKLGWNIRLYSLLFLGILGSGVIIVLMAWCISRRGPLFASVFTPLHLIFVTITSPLILAEKLYMGSMLGGAVIVFGLYLVLWGKKREAEIQMANEKIEIEAQKKAKVEVDP